LAQTIDAFIFHLIDSPLNNNIAIEAKQCEIIVKQVFFVAFFVVLLLFACLCFALFEKIERNVTKGDFHQKQPSALIVGEGRQSSMQCVLAKYVFSSTVQKSTANCLEIYDYEGHKGEKSISPANQNLVITIIMES
jgi:hypothetical protein